MGKKILVICDGFLPPKVKVAGGKNLYLIQRCLSSKGFIMHVVEFIHKQTFNNWQEWRQSQEKRNSIKFHVYDIPLRKIYPLHLFLTRVSAFFIVLCLQVANKFDLIHEYSSSPFLVNRTYLLGLLTGTKTLHTICTVNLRFTGSEKLLMRCTDRLICTTENMKNRLSKKIKKKVDFIPTPVEDKFFHEPSGNCRETFNIRSEKMVLFCGLLDDRKGISCFLEAIPEIMRRNSDTAIVILTAPGMNTFPVSRRNREKVYSTTCNYGGRVILIEEEVDMRSLLSVTDVHVYPPLTMHGTLGSPSILIEGMATGRAITASRLPEIAAIINDGENGLLFNPGDSQDLSRTVNRLLENQELRMRLGKQAKLDSQKYRPSLICDKITSLYNELLDSPK